MRLLSSLVIANTFSYRMVNDAGYGTGLPCCSSCVKPLAYDNTIWTALQSHNKLLSSKNTETISVVIGTARTKIKVRRQWRRTWRDDSDHMNDNVWSVEGSNNIVVSKIFLAKINDMRLDMDIRKKL